MKCIGKIIVLTIVALMLSAWLPLLVSPSWRDLGRLAGDRIRGGTSCWIDGSQFCPWKYTDCPNSIDCGPAPQHYCNNHSGDTVLDSDPAQAVQDTVPGTKSETSTPYYVCAQRYNCAANCVYDIYATPPVYCCAKELYQYDIMVTKSVPSGDACSGNEE